MTESNDQIHDIIVAGAGLAGAMAVARLHDKFPQRSIVVLEKENVPGGRLRSTDEGARRWGYGLKAITADLFKAWDQILKQDPEGPDLPSYLSATCERAGILQANRLTEVGYRDLWTEKGVRAVAGGAAARDWKTMVATREKTEKNKKVDHAFGQVWEGTRKSPAGIAMEQLAHAWGIPDLWDASAGTIFTAAETSRQGAYSGKWEDAIQATFARPGLKEQLTLKTDCRVVDAKWDGDTWVLQTSQGLIKGKVLVVAQSPWDAIGWLPKGHIPDQVIVMANKAKPVSVAVLSETIASEHELPEVIFIPSEDVQVWIHDKREISFQATLDYEITMQAPEVVKAVKRLRRAKKKLQAAFPDLKLEGDHLSLLPVGWSLPPSAGERRWAEKLEKQEFQSPRLVFCGDAYGAGFDGDQNLLTSVHSAVGAVT